MAKNPSKKQAWLIVCLVLLASIPLALFLPTVRADPTAIVTQDVHATSVSLTTVHPSPNASYSGIDEVFTSGLSYAVQLKSVSFWCDKVGSPAGHLAIKITSVYSSSPATAGFPDATNVYQTDLFDMSLLPTPAAYYSFALSGFILQPNTYYAITVTINDATVMNTANYVRMFYQNTNVYASGCQGTFANNAWGGTHTYDMRMKLYAATSITLSASGISDVGQVAGGAYSFSATATDSGATTINGYQWTTATADILGDNNLIGLNMPVAAKLSAVHPTASATAYSAVGQSFVGDGLPLGAASFKMIKAGAPAGNLKAMLYTQLAGRTYGTNDVPAASSLEVSSGSAESVSLASISSATYTWYQFTFSGNTILTRGAYYCIILYVVNATTIDEATNYINVATSSSGEHLGNYIRWTNNAWGYSASFDAFFKIHHQVGGLSSSTTAYTAVGNINPCTATSAGTWTVDANIKAHTLVSITLAVNDSANYWVYFSTTLTLAATTDIGVFTGCSWTTWGKSSNAATYTVWETSTLTSASLQNTGLTSNATADGDPTGGGAQANQFYGSFLGVNFVSESYTASSSQKYYAALDETPFADAVDTALYNSAPTLQILHPAVPNTNSYSGAISQAFMGNGENLTSILVYMRMIGTVTNGNLKMALTSDSYIGAFGNGDVPGALLETSSTVLSSVGMTSAFAAYSFTFSGNTQLKYGDFYNFYIYTDSGTGYGSSNYFSVQSTTTLNNNGLSAKYIGGWIPLATKLCFYVYGTTANGGDSASLAGLVTSATAVGDPTVGGSQTNNFFVTLRGASFGMFYTASNSQNFSMRDADGPRDLLGTEGGGNVNIQTQHPYAGSSYYSAFSQSFTGNGGYLQNITVNLMKTSVPTGNMRMALAYDSGVYGLSSTPSTLLETSPTTFSIATFPIGFLPVFNYTFVFSGNTQLEAGKYYNFYLYPEGSALASSAYVSIECSTVASRNHGNMAYYQSSMWNPIPTWNTISAIIAVDNVWRGGPAYHTALLSNATAVGNPTGGGSQQTQPFLYLWSEGFLEGWTTGGYPTVGMYYVDSEVPTSSTGNNFLHTGLSSLQFYTTAYASPGGSISPSGVIAINYGQDQRFDFTPNNGFSITSVLVDGVNVGTPAYYVVSGIETNHIIVVNFGGAVGGTPYIQSSFRSTPYHPDQNQLVTFDGSMSVSSNAITDYEWNFGDGNTTAGNYPTIIHKYAVNGTYEVTLTTTSSAGTSSLAAGVVVGYQTYTWIQAAFNWLPSHPDKNQNILFDASMCNSRYSISNYQWDFGDGNVTSGAGYSAISHKYATNGTYIVTLTVTGADGSSAISEGIVIGYPTETYIQTAFDWSPLHPELNQLVTFDGTMSIAHSPITNYQWNFGDGNTTAGNYPTITHSYASNGTFSVILATTSADGTSVLSNAIVIGYPTASYIKASYTWTPEHPDQNQQVTFNSVSISHAPISNYEWNFGDGNTTSGSYPSIWHTYASNSTYTTTLTVTSENGVSSISHPIVIGYPSSTYIQSVFVWSPARPDLNEPIDFDSTMSLCNAPITNYVWNFGDGNATSGNYPTITHRYGSNASYTVTLTIYSSSENSAISHTVMVGFEPASYNAGYDAGYLAGLAAGNSTGFNIGWQLGNASGYNDGWTAGWQNGNATGWVSGYGLGWSDGNSTGWLNGYSTGYAIGLLDGNASGYNLGWAVGNATGFVNGYNSGYLIGWSDGNFTGWIDGDWAGWNDGNAYGYAVGWGDGNFTGWNDGYLIGFYDGNVTGYALGIQQGEPTPTPTPMPSPSPTSAPSGNPGGSQLFIVDIERLSFGTYLQDTTGKYIVHFNYSGDNCVITGVDFSKPIGDWLSIDTSQFPLYLTKADATAQGAIAIYVTIPQEAQNGNYTGTFGITAYQDPFVNTIYSTAQMELCISSTMSTGSPSPTNDHSLPVNLQTIDMQTLYIIILAIIIIAVLSVLALKMRKR